MGETLTKAEFERIREQVDAIDREINWLDTSNSHENDRLSQLLSQLDAYESTLIQSIKAKQRRRSGLRVVA